MTVAQKRIEAGKQVATSGPRPRPAGLSEWAAARSDATDAETPSERADQTPHVVVDLRPDADRIPGPMPAQREVDYGLGRRWGAAWHAESASVEYGFEKEMSRNDYE